MAAEAIMANKIDIVPAFRELTGRWRRQKLNNLPTKLGIQILKHSMDYRIL